MSGKENEVPITAEDARRVRERLIEEYINNDAYSNISTQADGLNHLAFATDKIDETINFYTKIVGLKLLRIRPLDNDPRSTMVFFDLGRGELLVFLRLADVHTRSPLGVGGIHHFALTITHEQFNGFKKRAQENGIAFKTISHEMLTSISAVDPNGLEVELSVWNMDPKDMSQNKELKHAARS
jgi:catechol 2,3-dioxygenase-like lactoylglutathione lyase family enzyme